MTITQQFAPNYSAGASAPIPQPYAVATAAGAITIAHGTVYIGGTTTALTLAAPPTSMNGAVLNIVAITASAHTVTVAGGVNAGTTSTDVATFGGAIGDSMTLTAYNGVWLTAGALRNVTLG